MSNFRNLAGKPDKWDQSFQNLSSDNYEFLYGRSKGKRDCISSRKFLQCSFFGELLFCSPQRRRRKSKLICITVVQWSRSCLNVQINRVRLPSTPFSVSLYRFWSLFFNTMFLSKVGRVKVSCVTSVDGIILWLLIWLVNYVGKLLVVCQLSREVIGYEDS